MFRKIEDFLGTWSYEREATVKVFSALTDESLELRVNEDGRTLGRLAWHIAQTLPEMGGRTGLRVAGPGEDETIPTSASELLRRFEEAASSILEEVQASWTDADLEVQDDMYGELWMRGKSLSALIMHQTHHRGQMTVLMRQAGLKVPGVYGPAKEEWTEFGMPPQE